MNYAWIGPTGQWLTYGESHTHTGRHQYLGETADLSGAYVGSALPRYNESKGVDPTKFTAVPAMAKVVRTVTLGVQNEPTELPTAVPALQPETESIARVVALEAQVASLVSDIELADKFLSDGNNNDALVQIRSMHTRASKSHLDCIGRSAIKAAATSNGGASC